MNKKKIKPSIPREGGALSKKQKNALSKDTKKSIKSVAKKIKHYNTKTEQNKRRKRRERSTYKRRLTIASNKMLESVGDGITFDRAGYEAELEAMKAKSRPKDQKSAQRLVQKALKNNTYVTGKWVKKHIYGNKLNSPEKTLMEDTGLLDTYWTKPIKYSEIKGMTEHEKAMIGKTFASGYQHLDASNLQTKEEKALYRKQKSEFTKKVNLYQKKNSNLKKLDTNLSIKLGREITKAMKG